MSLQLLGDDRLGKLNDEQTELMMQWEELENRKAQLDGEK